MGRKAKDAAQKKIGEWIGVRRNVSTEEKAPKTATSTTTTTTTTIPSKTTTKLKPAAVPATKTKIKTNENTNTSNENCSPLRTHSQSELNAMKNCTVHLEKLEYPSKQSKQQLQQSALTLKKTPAPTKKSPVAVVASDADAPVIVKQKQTDVKKIYDYSFDDDINDALPLETGQEDIMKDLYDKMAKENKIVVKKYRPKNVKKQKTIADDKEKPSKKAAATRKRPREKQQATHAEQPPQKRLNLKNKPVTNTDGDDVVVVDKRKIGTAPTNVIVTNNVNGNGISTAKKVTILEDIVIKPKETITASKTAQQMDQVNVQPRLRNHMLNKFQSTPKSSTPLSTKTKTAVNTKEHSLNSLFFGNVSPLNISSTRPTRGNVIKQRLQLSAINNSGNVEPLTSFARDNAQENNAPVQPMELFDDFDDGIDFTNDVASEPQSSKFTKRNKENSLDRPGPSTSTATNPSPQPSTSSAGLVQNRPSPLRALNPQAQASTSAGNSIRRFGTNAMASSSQNNSAKSSDAGTTSRTSNNYSLFEINDVSDNHVSPPTKRRVYGRSPLKNITSEVNNTNSPSFQMFKSPSSVPRSFGALKKSTLNSTSAGHSSVQSNITLPEGSYFTSRRTANDFDRTMNDSKLMDDYFGFNDEDDIDNNNGTLIEQSKSMTSDSMSKAKSGALNEIRARLKRFLHNPDAANVTLKRSKATEISNKPARKRAIKTPIKSPTKKPNRTPVKRNVVFADTGSKQKDIRSAFTTKMPQNEKHTKVGTTTNTSDEAIILFDEVVPNQDRRRSYSRPQRHRKRRISIESEGSEEEDDGEQHSDNDEIEADEKSTKRAKRRKKMTETNPKEPKGLDEFARELNAHFEEVENFELIVVKEKKEQQSESPATESTGSKT